MGWHRCPVPPRSSGSRLLLNRAPWPANAPGLALKGCLDIAYVSDLSISASCQPNFPKGWWPRHCLHGLAPSISGAVPLPRHQAALIKWLAASPSPLLSWLSAFVHVEAPSLNTLSPAFLGLSRNSRLRLASPLLALLCSPGSAVLQGSPPGLSFPLSLSFTP